MKNRFLLPILGIIISLAGCSSLSESEIHKMAEAQARESGKTRLTVYRDTSSMTYMGTTARVFVNGSLVAKLYRGESFVGNYPPGKLSISTDTWSYPGRYTVEIEAKPDEDVFLAISPRESSVAWTASLGLIGMAIDGAVTENAGAFQLTIKGQRGEQAKETK